MPVTGSAAAAYCQKLVVQEKLAQNDNEVSLVTSGCFPAFSVPYLKIFYKDSNSTVVLTRSPYGDISCERVKPSSRIRQQRVDVLGLYVFFHHEGDFKDGYLLLVLELLLTIMIMIIAPTPLFL